ncbi:MAG TPA: ATP-dependent RecD-like DNA helicase, partial [Thermoanaerobaculia bacterium]
MDQLRGTVERVTFRNPENGFTVFRIRVEGSAETARVVGIGPDLTQGERIEASGAWIVDRTHGKQFQASRIATSAPSGRAAIETYLASGAVRGVGPHLAKKLFETFGERVFDVIEREPETLRRIRGIGKAKAASIAASWGEQKASRDLMLFLHEHGVTPARAARIHKQYGADAIRLIRENPYRLADEVRGIGFLSADSLAQRLGIPRESMDRVRAGIRYALEQKALEGHCGYPRDLLLNDAATLLGVPPHLVEQGFAPELESRQLAEETIEGKPAIFLGRLWHAEASAAKRLLRLAEAPLPWAIQTEKAIAWVEPRLGIALSPTQRAAIARALSSKVSVITGGPGVGKTTIVRAIVEIVEAKKKAIELAAPTGRAAKRMSEATGRDARTIHRLLEIDPRRGEFQRNELAPLECDLVIVDEASMIDVPLLDALVRAIPDRAAVLFVGDADQLPSVGPGQALSDLIACGAFPVSELREIHRQAAGSMIVVNAHRVNEGEPPLAPDDVAAHGARRSPSSPADAISDFYIVDASDGAAAREKIVRLVGERIPSRFGLDPRADVQVLSPMHRGGAGVASLNAALQAALNPRAAVPPRFERAGSILAPGDKVMQTENDYDKDVFNGDLGVVRSVDVASGVATIDFDGRLVEYAGAELDAVALAWATTIHKSQGSEYPAVVIALLTEQSIMLQRNLLYTAITRGRKLVVLVG